MGRRINWRLLHLERTVHDCGLSQAKLSAPTAPSRTAQGQPAPALKLGDPRVTALLGALCLFVLTPEGITNRRFQLRHAPLARGAPPPGPRRQRAPDPGRAQQGAGPP